MKTELVFILDRSGSMSGLEKDTIGGFNSLIEKQKNEEGKAYVSCLLFDHEQELIYDHVLLEQIKPMDEKQYYVRGCTALYDALGSAIQHIKKVQNYMEQKPDKTMFVITTDGMENASKEYSLMKVKALVEQQKEKGWEFLFLGANLDAVSVGKGFGIEEDHAVTFECDSVGTSINYEAISEAVTMVRHGKVLSKAWKAPIESDYQKRHK